MDTSLLVDGWLGGRWVLAGGRRPPLVPESTHRRSNHTHKQHDDRARTREKGPRRVVIHSLRITRPNVPGICRALFACVFRLFVSLSARLLVFPQSIFLDSNHTLFPAVLSRLLSPSRYSLASPSQSSFFSKQRP
uniref:Uncharacterized protein n=1 Tax=Caenorhabditis tropicalis TaxID=1561998 RepID=A0A1I7TFC2_9PELO